jgi:tripartite ATP-independent transporter DctM subunit
MMIAFVFLMFLTLIALRVPVAVSLILTAFAGMVLEGVDPINVVSQSYRGIDSFTLLAVPFFLALGFVISRTSVIDRLLDLASILVGWVRGGLGHVNIVNSMLFAGLSGSAVADTSSEGPIIIPLMQKRGYSLEYAAAITAATSTIGLIIPPSILMVVYAATNNTSVGALFLAGFVPGLLIGGLFLIINYFEARRRNIDYGRTQVHDDAAPLTVVQVVLRGVPALVIPVLVIGGVAGGLFTATEAGAVALGYTLILTIVVFRDLKVNSLGRFFRDSVLLYSLPMLAVAAAAPFGWMLTLLGAQDIVASLIQSLDLTPFTFLLLVIGVFLVLGTFLDGIPAIIIFAPLFAQGAVDLGIHPIQLGIIISVVLAIGLVTPPYGLCLLIAARLARVPVIRTLPALAPFLGAEILVCVLLAAFPELALFIPRVFAPDLF